MLNELSKKIYENAVDKGFWESDNLAEKFMLVVTEISEAVERLRETSSLPYELNQTCNYKNTTIGYY